DEEIMTSSKYIHLPTAISAGLPFEVDGVTNYDNISMPDELMGKYAGHKVIIISKINGLNKKKESMRVRIEELGNNRVDTSDIEELIPSLKNIDEWKDEEQQITIIKLIDSITLYNGKLVIDWVF